MPDGLRPHPPRIVARAVSASARIEVAQGSDWNDSLQLLEGGAAMDLTGCAADLFVRPTFDDPILIASLSSATGDILFDDAAAGKLQIYRPGWWVAELPAGAWVFVFRLRKAGEMREVCRGPFWVHPAEYP